MSSSLKFKYELVKFVGSLETVAAGNLATGADGNTNAWDEDGTDILGS